MDLNKINTERRNERTTHIDEQSTEQILTLINEEDRIVPQAVAKVIPETALVVDHIVASIRAGGRLIYCGAGTSGRLGILDASECPPTYGTDPNLVVGIIAGAEKAITEAVEGAEDNKQQGREDVRQLHLQERDVIVGIAASGRTPYTIGALEYGNEVGATTVALVCSSPSEMERVAKYTIAPLVGPEVITGSTRMKAGTAQKLVLNMLSTATMIKLGKVYENLMVDVQPTNKKLIKRASSIVMMATGVTEAEAEEALKEQNYHTKGAILSLLTGLRGEEVRLLLDEHQGYLRQAIKATQQS